MSTPKVFDPTAKDANIFYYLTHEIIHAQSSLNMEPGLIENPDPDARYLSELHEWAIHAMDHLHAAFDAIHKWEKYDPGCWDNHHIVRWIDEDGSEEVKNEKGLSRKVLKLLEENRILREELDKLKG